MAGRCPGRFPDHFSATAADYSQFRPRYSDALLAFLASLCRRRDVAWDCATGSGQAAIDLTEYFKQVIATDASAEQIANALQHTGVEYRVAPAENSGLRAASVDLITVAQALHWFDQDRFAAEAKRVLRPGGIVAAWCYGKLILPDAQLQSVFDSFYHDTVGPYWPEQRRIVESGYANIVFPFDELPAPDFSIDARLNADALTGYFGTWSATRRYRKATGHDPLPDLRTALLRTCPDASEIPVRWPISLRVGCLPDTPATGRGDDSQ